MSRYLLLIIFNIPFVIAAIVSIITQYKLKKITKGKLYLQLILWLIVSTGLLFTQPLYTFLFSAGLTQTESLSLFDVVQITAIVGAFFIINRLLSRLETLERRVNDFHQEISIRMTK